MEGSESTQSRQGAGTNSRPSPCDTVVFVTPLPQAVPETAGIKFPDFKSAGVTLRSQRVCVPSFIVFGPWVLCGPNSAGSRAGAGGEVVPCAAS